MVGFLCPALNCETRRRVARPSGEQVEQAVSTLIRWWDDDPDREGLIATPARVVRAYEEWFAGCYEDPDELLQRTFEEVAGYDEMVLMRDIHFVSHCEHHMAPITGRAHIGYLPRNRVVGIRNSPATPGKCQAASDPGANDGRNRKYPGPRTRTPWRGSCPRGDAWLHDNPRRTPVARRIQALARQHGRNAAQGGLRMDHACPCALVRQRPRADRVKPPRARRPTYTLRNPLTKFRPRQMLRGCWPWQVPRWSWR